MNPPQSGSTVSRGVYRKVRLEVAATGAKEVIVTGEFTGWAKEGVRLSPTGSGSWETTLQLAPGEYQYRLIVDGQWKDHAAAQRRVPNPYGTRNCILEVR